MYRNGERPKSQVPRFGSRVSGFRFQVKFQVSSFRFRVSSLKPQRFTSANVGSYVSGASP